MFHKFMLPPSSGRSDQYDQSLYTTDGQSPNQSVLASRPFRSHDQILVIVRLLRSLSWSVLPIERTVLYC